MRHPADRAARKVAAAKREIFDWTLGNEHKARSVRKAQQDHASKVWRKLRREQLEAEDYENEIRSFKRDPNSV